jgi:hypothetical protein
VVVPNYPSTFAPYFESEAWDLSGCIARPTLIGLYETDDAKYIIIGDHVNGKIIKWNADSHELVASLTIPLSGKNKTAFRNGISSDGKMWVIAEPDVVLQPFRLQEIDLETLTVSRSIDLSEWGFDIQEPATLALDEELGCLWVTVGNNKVVKLYLDRIARSSVTLPALATDIAEAMGLVAADIDVTGLAGPTVNGMVISGDDTGRTAIETLQSAYFFDGVESDWELKFKLRDGISAGTVDEDDLGAHVYGESRPVPLLTSREIDIDIPQAIEVKYLDIDAEHEIKTQTSSREPTTMSSRNRETISLPLVMDKDLAKQIAEKQLFLAWKQKEGEYEFQVPWKYLKYDPGDVITVPYKGTNYLLSLTEIQLGANLIMACKALPDAGYCYDSQAEGAATTDPEGAADPSEISNSKGILDFRLLDIPLVKDSDNNCGFYFAARSSYAWEGTRVLCSPDGVSDYNKAGYLEEESVIGSCRSVLGSVSGVGVLDLVNTLTVQLFDAANTLESATEEEVLNGANQCLVGDEIIRFINATNNGDGNYTLSGLMRGMRGTEWAVGLHTFGERFIMLDDRDKIGRITMSASDIDTMRYYIAMPTSGDESDHPVYRFKNTAVGKKPFAPCHVRGTRDGSNNLTITWKRRTRIGGEWLDGQDIPLGEAAESYEVDIYKSGAVVRTITATTETATYTAAQQTADGITPGTSVDLIAYQISSIVDRGYGAAATV